MPLTNLEKKILDAQKKAEQKALSEQEGFKSIKESDDEPKEKPGPSMSYSAHMQRISSLRDQYKVTACGNLEAQMDRFSQVGKVDPAIDKLSKQFGGMKKPEKKPATQERKPPL